MSESDFAPSETYPCENCRTGVMRPRLATYATWLGAQLVTVPHFPAWVCDVCGKCEYDAKAVQWLNALLSPEAGKPTQAARQARPVSQRQSAPPRPHLDS